MNIEALRRAAEEAATSLNLFILDLKERPGNAFAIFVDGEDFVTLEKLSRLNKLIEAAFDRDMEDFSLEVSSPGATTPLTDRRQLPKHLGAPMQLLMNDGKKVKGELSALNEEGLTLRWKERVPKEIGKGKQTIEREEFFAFSQVKEAKRTVNFNR